MSRLEDQLADSRQRHNEAALNKCIEQRDRAEKYCGQLKIMLASASDRADEQKQRAEAAEARAAQLEVERDAALLELQQIRTMLDGGDNGNASTAIDMVKRLQAECYALRREAWYERM